ncbi:MAG: SpoIIE family protein phosphatase [Phycisphaerae bacterium]|nr:SpoIIE family protein phosphatase [Phycisphaerae bacterium]
MRIRWKLLILLLGIALLPLGVLSWINQHSLRTLGREFGTHAREDLSELAGRQLSRLTNDYGAAIRRERETIELVLRIQAREVEQCLAGEPPLSPPVFWAADYDGGHNLPEGMTRSDKHVRLTADGRRERVPVTYEQQVFVSAPGVSQQTVRGDVARLTLLLPAYQLLHEGHPELIAWNYTALHNGVHCSYPGHGGYPADFDPRRRAWYLNALVASELTWNAALVDATTREVMVTVSMPVRGPDGTVVGVTAIDIRLLGLLESATVPAAWSADARSLLVVPMDNPAMGELGGLIVAQESYLQADRRWDEPIELEWLASDDNTQLHKLLDDLAAGRANRRLMPYQGRESLWAYSSTEKEGAAVLLIVPQDDIIAHAVAAEESVRQGTRILLEISGVAAVIVALVVLLLALLSSRAVTRPVAALANAARRIAAGDLQARTHIETRDELGELGHAFNSMLPKLADRMRLRESLALAMQVQQKLLPARPPRVAGLDIAGRSIYCDETGGDYYDFLQLTELGPRRLGVAVGDVTGHGIAAALLMATGRALLRSRIHGPGSLAQVLTDINRQLTADTAGERFMTLVYLLIDVETRTLRWVSAGHDAPILYHPNSDSFSELSGGGIPLGIEVEWRYEEYGREVPAEGQIIVIGTDGIWETHNPAGEMFGKEMLRRIIRANAQRSAEEISSTITTAVADFRHTGPQEDDITLVVIKVL